MSLVEFANKLYLPFQSVDLPQLVSQQEGLQIEGSGL